MEIELVKLLLGIAGFVVFVAAPLLAFIAVIYQLER